MSQPRPAPPRTRWRFATLLGLAGALVVGIVVLAFVWPAATATARDLPVGIAGPTSQVTALKDAMARRSTQPFDFVAVGSRADAVQRIRDREIYGAVLLGDSPEVLTSSAASAASNQALRGVATGLQAQISAGAERGLAARLQQTGRAVSGLQHEVAALKEALRTGGAGAPAGAPTGGAAAGLAPAIGAPAASGAPGGAGASATTPPTVAVTDVVALSSHDSTGSGLAAAGFPIVLGGMLGGVLISLLVAGPIRRLLALLVYGVGAGVVVTLALQTWLQILQRDWLTNAAAFGLAMAATASVLVGCSSLIGRPGIALGGVVSLLIANPISGATLPYQFIAGPWGAVGQWFVPGAAANLVRTLSYFPDAGTGRQWLTLGCWLAGGLLLTLVGHFRAAVQTAGARKELERQVVRRAAATA